MFKDIGPYAYRPLITRLKNYYKSVKDSYYKTLYKHVEKYFDKPYPILTSTKWTDEMMLQYTKCRPNIKLLLLWKNSTSNKQIQTLFKLIKDNEGHIYYRKQFTLTKNGIDTLYFQLTKKSTAPPKLKIGGDQLITAILYELPSSKKINLKPPLKTHIIINNPIQVTQLIFNKNSIDFLNNQLLKRHIDMTTTKQKNMINTYKSYIKNLQPIDQIRAMLFSSSVLYMYGVRQMGDIDAYIVNLSAKSPSSSTTLKVINALKKEPDTDISLKGTDGWESYWEKYLNKFATIIGSNNFNNLVLDPKYHFYTNGVKLITLKADIQKRLLRLRPQAYADIIAINILFNYDIKLPKIPVSVPFYKDVVDPVIFVKTIKFALKKKYNINATIDQINSYISKRYLSPPQEFTNSNANTLSLFMEQYNKALNTNKSKTITKIISKSTTKTVSRSKIIKKKK